MDNLQASTPIRPLHVEIDGMSKYRQAHSVEDLASFLLSEKWPHVEHDPGRFHRALATLMDAMQLYGCRGCPPGLRGCGSCIQNACPAGRHGERDRLSKDKSPAEAGQLEVVTQEENAPGKVTS